jgi:hypothetical protein
MMLPPSANEIQASMQGLNKYANAQQILEQGRIES